MFYQSMDDQMIRTIDNAVTTSKRWSTKSEKELTSREEDIIRQGGMNEVEEIDFDPNHVYQMLN